MGTLAAYRQGAPVSQPAIAADIHQALDVHLHALAQIAFDFSLRLQDGPDATQLILAQIPDASIKADRSLFEDRTRARTADAINVSQTHLGSFVRWKIDACYTCHFFTCSPLTLVSGDGSQFAIANLKSEIQLSLALLVFRVDANNAHHAFAMNHLALVAHFFN